jgi:tetratricopeptide (TPR) repeat protein
MSITRSALDRCRDDRRGDRQRVRLLTSIGRYQLSGTRYADAIETFHEALTLARTRAFRHLEADLRNHLGETAARETRYQEALDNFVAAVQIDRELGDRVGTGTKLANLGITYSALGQHRRARRYLNKALELQRVTGHAGLVSEVLVNLGAVDDALGDHESAQRRFSEALDVAQRHGDRRTTLRARSRRLRLDIDRALARPLTADHHPLHELFTEARALLDDARRDKQRSPQVRVLHGLSLLAEHIGDNDAAITHVRKAVELVHHGAAALDGVLSIYRLGRLLSDIGHAEANSLMAEAASLTQQRLDDLRDPALRRAYLDLTDVQAILGFAAP